MWNYEPLTYDPGEQIAVKDPIPAEPITGCQTATDAIVKILSRGESIENLEAVADRTGVPINKLVSLRGTVVFQDPSFFRDGTRWDYSKGYVLREKYLSGDVMEKYRIAREMDLQYPGCFQPNIEELEKLLPKIKDLDEISIPLGSVDVNPKYYEQFIWDALHIKTAVRYSREMAKWIISLSIQDRERAKRSELNNRIYGTRSVPALAILEKTMNGRPIRFDDMRDTLEAKGKQEAIREKWDHWVEALSGLQREQLMENYVSRLGRYTGASFTGKWLSFPGLNPEIQLREHQRKAVERALLADQNCLIIYPTGSGKTYIYIAIAHERKRLGLSKKIFVVVPNNVLSATVRLHHKMYPDDAVFCVKPTANFRPDQRMQTLEHIRTHGEEYTCVYIPFSSFDMIRMSRDYWVTKYEDEIQSLRTAVASCHYRTEKHQLEKLLHKKKTAYFKFVNEPAGEEQIPYDELGCDLLICDEVQYYKNPPLDSRNPDFSRKGAKKSKEFQEKVHTTKRVVFGTATPITNSYSELYVHMHYLMPEILEEAGIASFDSWINTFAEIEDEEEINELGTSMKVRSRYKKFHNLQQLTSMIRMCLEFTSVEEGETPLYCRYRDIHVARGPELDRFFRELEKRAFNVKTEKNDNILKIMMQARLATLDLRLVGRTPDRPGYRKTDACTKEVYKVYEQYPGCSQIVFCDIGVPGNVTFNVYQEMKDLLTARGIPAEEIAFIHEASDKTRDWLLRDVNEGKIRVIIGSTAKLGVGVNCQKHLKAIHHLSVPWRASDILQREGRINRDGNECEEIFIYRYYIKDTFDTYLWQTVERKAREYCQLLEGTLDAREIEDMEITACSAGEFKAICVGNPLIKIRAVISNELEKNRIAARQENREFTEMEAFAAGCPGRIDRLRAAAEDAVQDWEYHMANKESVCREERMAFGEELLLAVKENVMMPNERVFGDYQKMQVVLPAGYFPDQPPFVYLKRYGRNRKYYLELDTEKPLGCCQRIDTFLGNLNRYSGNLLLQIDDLNAQLESTKQKLSKGKKYGARVAELSLELESVDAEIRQGEKRYA